MSKPKKDQRRRAIVDIFHNEVTAWLVLVVSLLFTALGWYISSHYVETRAAERFAFEVEDASQRILKRMLEYQQVLRGGVSFVDTLGRLPSRAEWRQYVDGLEIETYYPGIQGIGFSVMLSPSAVPSHIAAVRDEGFPDYQLKPAGVRDAYSAIIYLEPFDWRNRRAFGYDMFSNPMRRDAMSHARDTGSPAVSGRVILVQETDENVQAGFLVYLPVYATGRSVQTVAQRREALLGFVYSPFRATDLMRGILGSDTPDVGFELYDGTGEPSADTLLFDTNPDDASVKNSARQRQVRLDFAGRTWQVTFHSRPSFDTAMSSSQPELIAIGGSLVDILLFIIIWSMAGERRRVEARAHDMTADFRAISQRLDMAQASVNIGTWDYDVVEDRLLWDERMFRIYGVERETFACNFDAWRQYPLEEDGAAAEALFQKALKGEAEFDTRFRIRLPSGEVRVIEAHATILRDANGQAQRIVGVNQDVTERQHTEEQLKLAASVFDHAHEGIVITDAQERILKVNPTFSELTGYGLEEVMGETPRTLKSGHHDAAFYADMWQQLDSEGYWHGEIWNRRKNGEIYAELLTISAVVDVSGQVSHYVAIFSDISKLKEQQVKLERMAHYDALTQMPNRVLLTDRMQQAMAQARRSGLLLAVCYLDLDGFKPVNDSYGHEMGDKLLVKVADRLQKHMRVSDTVARLGGDEFALLFNNLESVHECERALTRLLEAMGASYQVAGHSIVISASIGVALFPYDNADNDTLLRHADQAMYRAKENGRNRFHLFDPEQDRQARAHREALSRIEQALDSEEFVLYYQPKVDMRQGRMIGAEALIRWEHPERGLLPPAEFLPIVEEGEFSSRLGEWVIDRVLSQLADWRRAGFETSVSVNISGRHIQQAGFSQRLASLMCRHPDVRPSQLELEVLETSALEDIGRVSRVIQECRAQGVMVALDDFGTGYSSLTYLKRLPADILKIDQTFVRDMLEDVEDLAIIEGIIGLCQAFRRRVIAEGIESEEHGVMLLRLGCDLGQGYGIARPMPANELLDWTEAYQPSPAWQEAGRHHWLHEDFPLLTAELVQRRWVNDLIATIQSGQQVIEPPELDIKACQFGRWYETEGRRRYGEMPGYRALGDIHERIHRHAQQLLDLRISGLIEEACNGIDDLRAMHQKIAEQLFELQTNIVNRNWDGVRTVKQGLL